MDGCNQDCCASWCCDVCGEEVPSGEFSCFDCEVAWDEVDEGTIETPTKAEVRA
jgi:hypothetical protein